MLASSLFSDSVGSTAAGGNSNEPGVVDLLFCVSVKALSLSAAAEDVPGVERRLFAKNEGD